MPTYSYQCDACNREFDKEQRISEAAIRKCPSCGKLKLRRLITGGNFILKGGGWYSDGYGSSKSAKSAKSTESASESKSSSESSSTTTKDTKPSTKDTKPSSGSGTSEAASAS